MLRRFLPKLSPDRARKIVVILGVAGMGCILLSSFLPSHEKAPPAEVTSSAEDYRAALESELTEILTAMEGVGEVRVLVTLDGSEEYRYAKTDDRTVSENQSRSSVSYVTVGGSREALLESVAHPGVTGVVVACEGASSYQVQEEVTHAVSVACGLPMNKVCVTRLRNTKGATP